MLPLPAFALPVLLQATAPSGVAPPPVSPRLPAPMIGATPAASAPSPAGTIPTLPPTPVRPLAAKRLGLAEALANAAKNQPTIRQAQAEVAVASARTEQARAGLLPQITATGQYQRTTGNFAPRPGAVGTGAIRTRTTSWETYNFFTFGLTATQLLYDFGQTTERTAAARATVDAQRRIERSVEVNVAFDTRTAYLLALAQKNLLGVADETLANEERHLAQIQGYVAGGTRPLIDLAQARTTVANARYQVIAAENAYETAKAMLNQAMGATSADTAFDVLPEPATPVENEDAPTARLAPAALAERPDIAALMKQREAGESTVRSFKGAYGPIIAAQGSATENGIALDGLVPNVAVGVTVTWPLFQGNFTRGQVHEAEAVITRVDAQLDVAKLQVRAELDQARLAIRSGKAAIAAAEEARTAARERLRLAEGRYAQGIGSVIELGDAQVALTATGAQVVSAELNLATARATLLRVLGRS